MQRNVVHICKDCSETKLKDMNKIVDKIVDKFTFAKSKFMASDGRSEWMWSKIVEIDRDSRELNGILDNDPVCVEMKCGDKTIIKFDDISDFM